MKTRYILIALLQIGIGLLTVVEPVGAVTCPLSGTIDANCSWTLADSPVDLSSITVLSGVTVTVGPDVVLRVSTGDMDIYGILNINNGASIIATNNQDLADIRVYPGGVLNLSDTATISHTGSGRINIDVYGSAGLNGNLLNVNTFSTYPGSTCNIVNSVINAGKIAFYKGSNCALASGNVFNGGVKADSDGDGVSDSSDNCKNTPSPDQADSDTDGVGDVCDNCSLTANSLQQNTDNDAYGNACDCDLDNNNFVGPSDFNIFKAAWLSDPSKANWNADADFDSDNFIGPKDFNIFKTRWLKSGPWK